MQAGQRLDDGNRRGTINRICKIGLERIAAPLVRHLVARIEEGSSLRLGLRPRQPRNAALLRPFVGTETDAGQSMIVEELLHYIGSADAAQDAEELAATAKLNAMIAAHNGMEKAMTAA